MDKTGGIRGMSHKDSPCPDRKSNGTQVEKLKCWTERRGEREREMKPNAAANSKGGSICPLHSSQEEHLK